MLVTTSSDEAQRTAGVPLITVVITSYNYRQYLGAAIESALTQDFPSFEVLVLDNCSTDGSEEIVTSYRSDPRLRYVRHERNIGITPNHNCGITAARGEYVIFLSADDFFLPGHLSRPVRFLGAHPEVDVLYTGYFHADADGRIFDRFTHPGLVPADYIGGRNEFAEILSGECYPTLPTVLFKKSFFEELGPLDERLSVGFDYEFFLRLAKAEKRFAYLQVPTMCVRSHGARRCGADPYVGTGQQLDEYLYIMEKYVTPDVYDRLRGWEPALARLIRHKIEHLRKYPAASAILAEQKPRIDALAARIDAIDRSAPRRRRSPRVSVVVPSSGRTGLLYDAVESVARQTFDDWEVIVVGDGDVDAQAVLERIGRSERIRYVRHQGKLGPAAARNTAIHLASGEIICYLDDDNRFDRRYLEHVVGALDASGATFAISASELVIEEFDPDVPGRRKELSRIPLDPARGLQQVLTVNSIPLNAVAHLRRCVEEVGFFNVTFEVLEDWEFVVRLLSRGRGAVVGASGVEVRDRVGFEGQLRRERAAGYLASVQRIYGAYGAPADGVAAQRARHLAGVPAAIAATFTAPADAAQTRSLEERLLGIVPS